MVRSEWLEEELGWDRFEPDLLAQRTGGMVLIMSGSGYVDLTQLPIASVILRGYVIRYRTVRTGTQHEVRLLLVLDGQPVADATWQLTY